MTVSNPLLFLPSPRNILEVEEAVSKLNISKLWIKYHTQSDAYDMARDFFLKQSKFTHLIICPDDLIVQTWDLDNLIGDYELNPNRIISGWCINTVLDNWEDLQDSNISLGLPPNPPHTGTYEGYHFISAEYIKSIINNYNKPSYLLQVQHQGFALTSIPRKIIEQIPFRTDDGCCVDSCFSLDLALNHIKQYVDLTIKSTHLKTKKEDLLVGKKNELVVFER